MESGGSLIIIGTLLEIIALHFLRRNITIIQLNAVSLALIVDMIVVKKVEWLHPGRVCEELIAIQTVFINTDITSHHELKDIRKQVYLTANRLNRVIKTGIRIISKVQLTVYITSPHNIFWHLLRSGKGYARPCGDVLGIRLLGVLLLLHTPSRRLSIHAHGYRCQ